MAHVCCFSFLLLFAVLGTIATGAEDQNGENVCSATFEASPGAGLDPKSFDHGAAYAAHLGEVSDAESCLQACCDSTQCSLVLLDRSGAKTQCYLVNCVAEGTGQNACVTTPDAHFDSYRKREGDSRSSSDYQEKCHAPIEVGPCRAAFPHFNYDPVNQICREFIYGGCKGNANNYESREDCERACTGVRADETSPNDIPLVSKSISKPVEFEVPTRDAGLTKEYRDSCEVAPVVGPCRASMPRFFYNSSSGSCQLFIYGGCKGNNNNYQTQAECQAKCSVNQLPVHMPVVKHAPAEYKDYCLAQVEVGPCRAAFRSWYYDPTVQDCLPFVFGGCGGNRNRYSSAQDCLSHCAGGPAAHGDREHPGHGFLNHHHRAAFVLTAVLAVMTVLLVVVLIVASLRKTRERQRLVIDDKEELLPSAGSEKA
ncbi:kunitz-type protease inhibitor 1-like [Polyodon spathula]|uniref:kunitz-type protease inhibitor 1-like n=1 Tax=Polyodon spathula TaxID=7913 RepID=UPI001B7F3589|nr:kunitz-type protease inhibitor 1-like [Polyodon spathula]